MLLQACIASASLGSSSTETLLVNNAVVKDSHAIPASITVFNWWILNAPRCQWPAVAATNLLFELAGTDIAALLLADVIEAMSLANTGAAITPAIVDVSTLAQRMMPTVTCHSPVSAVASCFPSGATSYCCCGDTNALLCTSGPPKTTVCLEYASKHDVLRRWTACTLARGACQCHICQCTTQQKTSARTKETHRYTKWSPRLNYASAGVPVSSQCWCLMAAPVSSTDGFITDSTV